MHLLKTLLVESHEVTLRLEITQSGEIVQAEAVKVLPDRGAPYIAGYTTICNVPVPFVWMLLGGNTQKIRLDLVYEAEEQANS